MGEIEEFNALTFEKQLMQLKDTQDAIQTLSSWCLKQRPNHKKIVASWLNVLKRVKVEQRLVLFYLANDVIQYSKRKNYEFVESWGLNLQKATPLVRDEKVRGKILRIFKIWEQRSVYDEEFLSDLTGLLSAGAIKKTDDDPLDFQPQQLVNKIKQCAVLEADTDIKLKRIHENHLQLSDAESLCNYLKDRSLKDDVEKELNEGIACVERYTQALQREIVAREALLALLATANQYYSTQRGEVKVVAYAYKSFGGRVRTLKRKLDELLPTIVNEVPSPPQRDEDVPSPGPDEDLELPAPTDGTDDDLAYNIDQSFNTTLGADGSLYNLGLSSFLSSENALAMFNESDIDHNSANKIEVINSRPNDKQDFNINDFLKTFVPNDTAASDNNSVVSATISQKSQDTLPGLDLLTPESTGNPPPPTSFYDDSDQPYIPEGLTNDQWNNTAWNLLPHVSPPRAAFADTPESPPPSRVTPRPPRAVRTEPFTQDLPAADVDHRGILPPPPPPPPVLPLLGQDVDHRLMPTLPPPPPPLPAAPLRHPTQHKDVDHRNLISLTHQLSHSSSLESMSMDQDYRVPSAVQPTDIVESVDMELSEDEDQRMFPNQLDHHRRTIFGNRVLIDCERNNVKVGKVNEKNANLIEINSTDPIVPPIPRENDRPHTAPVLPLSNPFDNMPPELKFVQQNSMPILNDSPTFENNRPILTNTAPVFDKLPTFQNNPGFEMRDEGREENSNESAYEEDLRSGSLENLKSSPHFETMPPPSSYDFASDSERSTLHPRPFLTPRFPRNWAPRTNFRPPFWPRNRPVVPSNRWMGPRPPRFW